MAVKHKELSFSYSLFAFSEEALSTPLLSPVLYQTPKWPVPQTLSTPFSLGFKLGILSLFAVVKKQFSPISIFVLQRLGTERQRAK